MFVVGNSNRNFFLVDNCKTMKVVCNGGGPMRLGMGKAYPDFYVFGNYASFICLNPAFQIPNITPSVHLTVEFNILSISLTQINSI